MIDLITALGPYAGSDLIDPEFVPFSKEWQQERWNTTGPFLKTWISFSDAPAG